jgi:hypothetical protein
MRSADRSSGKGGQQQELCETLLRDAGIPPEACTAL